MSLSEDRISTMAHQIVDRLWRDDLADLVDQGRALARVKQSLTEFFRSIDDVDNAVRAKLGNRAPGSRDWELLYQKFYQEELVRRGL